MLGEEKYRAIFNATSEAIFIHASKTGAILDVNQSMLDMYDYTRDEVLRMSVADLTLGEPPYSQLEADQKIHQVLEEGPQLFEWSARRRSGETFWGEVALRSSEIGGQMRVLAVVRDIRERKRVEEIIQLRLRLMEFAAAHSLEELLRKTLDEVGKLTFSPIGFYHFVDADQNSLLLQTWSTKTLEEFCKAEGKGLHYPIDQAGVWADCVRRSR